MEGGASPGPEVREEEEAGVGQQHQEDSEALEEERKGGGVLGRLRRKLGRGRPPASLASQAVVDDFMAALRSSRSQAGVLPPPRVAFVLLGNAKERRPSHQSHGGGWLGCRRGGKAARRPRRPLQAFPPTSWYFSFSPLRRRLWRWSQEGWCVGDLGAEGRGRASRGLHVGRQQTRADRYDGHSSHLVAHGRVR